MNNVTKIEYIANEAQKRKDLEFKVNANNINLRGKGKKTCYYANQCRIFTKLGARNGFGNYISAEKIKIQGISFNKYSINVGYSQYHQDLKRFNSKEEMLGFVIGYNEAQLQLDK